MSKQHKERKNKFVDAIEVAMGNYITCYLNQIESILKLGHFDNMSGTSGKRWKGKHN